MNSSDPTTNRMCDVALALREARQVRIEPTKIQLQKFVYLMDVVGQVVALFKPLEGHKTYKNGPYDPAIQNAVDSLAFRGFVRITGVWRTPSGHLGTKYTLSKAGLKFIDRIQKSGMFERKLAVATLVSRNLNIYGWHRIVELVYAEPTFVESRPSGWGAPLHSANGLEVSAAFLFAVMRKLPKAIDHDVKVSPEWLTERFFAYLDDYATSVTQHEVKTRASMIHATHA